MSLIFMQVCGQEYTEISVSLEGLVGEGTYGSYIRPHVGDTFVLTWYEEDGVSHLSGLIRLTDYKQRGRGKRLSFSVVPAESEKWTKPLPEPDQLYFYPPQKRKSRKKKEKENVPVKSLYTLGKHAFLKNIFLLFTLELRPGRRNKERQRFKVVDVIPNHM